MNLNIKKLHPDAILPTRANPTDAGLDIYSLEDAEIPATIANHVIHYEDVSANRYKYDIYSMIGSARISTGIAAEIHPGYWGEIKSRSGLGFKHGIEVGAGTIDAPYRGEIKVKLYNFTDQPYPVKKGDRIAQLVIQKCELWEPVEVDELGVTDRGEGGFGHTGL